MQHERRIVTKRRCNLSNDRDYFEHRPFIFLWVAIKIYAARSRVKFPVKLDFAAVFFSLSLSFENFSHGRQREDKAYHFNREYEAGGNTKPRINRPTNRPRISNAIMPCTSIVPDGKLNSNFPPRANNPSPPRKFRESPW